jgi:hypothetical protein
MTQPYDPQPQSTASQPPPAGPMPAQPAPPNWTPRPPDAPNERLVGHYPPPGGWSIGDDLPPRPPQRRSGKLLLIVLGVVVIIAVAVAAYFTSSGSATPNSTAKQPVESTGARLGSISPVPFTPTGNSTGDTAGDATGDATGDSTGLGDLNLCNDQSDPEQVASTYVAAALTGIVQAQNICVYQQSVPATTTQKLSGQLFVPVDGGSGSPSSKVFTFKTVSGSATAEVTVTRESDGKYWVTNVSVS